MSFSVRQFAEKINSEAEKRRKLNATALTTALEVWPWLGRDRRYAVDSLAAKHGGEFALNPGALGVEDWEKLRAWLKENPDRITPEFLVQIAALGFAAGESSVKRHQALSKNAGPRKWVVEQWVMREDREQSKAAFARDHVHFVKSRFGLVVTADTIARDWLPK